MPFTVFTLGTCISVSWLMYPRIAVFDENLSGLGDVSCRYLHLRQGEGDQICLDELPLFPSEEDWELEGLLRDHLILMRLELWLEVISPKMSNFDGPHGIQEVCGGLLRGKGPSLWCPESFGIWDPVYVMIVQIM